VDFQAPSIGLTRWITEKIGHFERYASIFILFLCLSLSSLSLFMCGAMCEWAQLSRALSLPPSREQWSCSPHARKFMAFRARMKTSRPCRAHHRSRRSGIRRKFCARLEAKGAKIFLPKEGKNKNGCRVPCKRASKRRKKRRKMKTKTKMCVWCVDEHFLPPQQSPLRN
jgi:hypothetical protein